MDTPLFVDHNSEIHWKKFWTSNMFANNFSSTLTSTAAASLKMLVPTIGWSIWQLMAFNWLKKRGHGNELRRIENVLGLLFSAPRNNKNESKWFPSSEQQLLMTQWQESTRCIAWLNQNQVSQMLPWWFFMMFSFCGWKFEILKIIWSVKRCWQHLMIDKAECFLRLKSFKQ